MKDATWDELLLLFSIVFFLFVLAKVLIGVYL